MPRRPAARWLRLGVTLVVAYMVYAGLLFFLQREMLFPRHLIPGAPPQHPPAEAEQVWLDLPDGPVEAWFFPHPDHRSDRPGPAAIFAHGNGERIDLWPPLLVQPLRELGHGLLLVEYPGYGRSAGSPGEEAITAAMIQAWDWLTAQPGVAPDRVLLIGRSLGGGAVCALTRHRPAAGVVLMSSFTSVRSFARRYGVPSALVRDPFDNLSALTAFAGPVLLIHGRRDGVIPFAHAEQLAAATPRAELVAVESGHNDCPPDWGAFCRTLGDWLSRHAPPRPEAAG